MGSDNHEALLEIGLVAFGLALLGGLVALLSGRAIGAGHRGRGAAESPPSRGSVEGGRHQHTRAVAAR